MSARIRRWLPPALALAAAFAAGAASAAPEWRDAKLSAGYRFTAGSGDYVGNAFLLRGRLRLTPDWSAYSRLDLLRDRAYDRALALIVGAERDLPRDWLAWAGAGFSDAEFQDGGGGSSFRLETGAGRPLGRWWADGEYRLVDGKIGQLLPGGAQSGSTSASQAMGMTVQQDGHHPSPGQPPTSAPAQTGSRFTQNEVTLLLASPTVRLGKPVSFGLSASYWTRSDGPDGFTPYGSAVIRLTPRWATLLGAWTDIPNGGSKRYYGSAGLRYAFLPR